jgi:hypothetical protein
MIWLAYGGASYCGYEGRSRMRLRKLAVLGCTVVTALAIGATTASADPTPDNNKNVGVFNVVCPGMAPFQVAAVGAVGFVQGARVLAIAQVAGQGSLDLVECQASGEGLTFTVFVQFVRRG